MDVIMLNIFCAGKNYALHAREMNSAVPDEPMIFSKATHALSIADGSILNMPWEKGSVHYEVELVFELSQPYETGMKPEDCIGYMGVGIDFTLRDVQTEARKKGDPWLKSKSFPGSALLTQLFSFESVDEVNNRTFSLEINGERVQHGSPSDMIFHLSELLPYISEHFGTGKGDLIFTGTPEGIGAVHQGDELSLIYDGEVKGTSVIG